MEVESQDEKQPNLPKRLGNPKCGLLLNLYQVLLQWHTKKDLGIYATLAWP